MRFPFRPDDGLIIVRAEVDGPTGSGVFRLALDTGATTTLVGVGLLVAIGYEPALATERVQVTTGSGVEFVPRIAIRRLRALGHARTDFPVLSHTLPPSAGIDGLLGLDFLRGRRLSVDFIRGEVGLR